MGSKVERVRTKQIQEKCQRLLNDMLKEDDNKYCVDCDAKGPRWASWNIGIFLCIRCAGIHRKLGVHISKVKSVNLDLWTPQQVVSLQQMGNSDARAVYEAHLPDNFRRPQSEGNLESFIRAKYEHKKFIAPEWVAPTLPKVNWDEEFQEEAEKLKKKKREVIQSNFLSIRPQSTTQVTPQPLAKPQYSSPKPLQMSSQATNLLELDTSKETVSKKLSSDFDLFTIFQSAPMDNSPNNASAQVLNGSNANSALKTEEEDSFFNQALSSTSNNQKPLTKDTILALYGNLENYVSPQLNKFHLSSLNGCNSAFTSPNIAQSTQQQFPNIAVTSTSNMALVSNPFYSMAASGGQSNFPLEKAFSIAPMSNGTGGSDVSQAQFAQRMEAMNLNKTNQLSFPPSSLFDANAEAKNQLQQNFEQFVPTTSLWE